MSLPLSRYFHDARTLSKLCKGAEDMARIHGRAKPASEHFVLAALGLPDGTASKAFERLSIDKSRFVAALEAQRASALAAVGVHLSPAAMARPASTLLPPASKLYEAEPSGQSLVQRLAASRGERKGRRLFGADVLLAVAQEVNSSASRAFHELAIDAAMLTAAASAEVMAPSARASDI